MVLLKRNYMATLKGTSARAARCRACVISYGTLALSFNYAVLFSHFISNHSMYYLETEMKKK